MYWKARTIRRRPSFRKMNDTGSRTLIATPQNAVTDLSVIQKCGAGRTPDSGSCVSGQGHGALSAGRGNGTLRSSRSHNPMKEDRHSVKHDTLETPKPLVTGRRVNIFWLRLSEYGQQ